MNYFKTIKAALDASFAGICEHLGVSPEEACKTIKQHLSTMSIQWFNGETPNIVYGDPLCRFAYLFCHVGANANLCEVAIRNSLDICNFIDSTLATAEELRVCAFGGGPGTELLAISKFLLGRHLPGHVEISFTLLDRVPEWAETWNALEAQIKAELKATYGPQSKRPFSTSKTFVPFDMTKAHEYANLSHLLQHDMYVMNYVIFEVVGDHVKFQEFITAAASAALSGSKFLIVDRDQDRVIANTNTLLTTAGLQIGTILKTSTNMDLDERMESLEPYISAIDRRPRLQWGSRSGRGAFYLVGTKP
jgi:hypothetical protein